MKTLIATSLALLLAQPALTQENNTITKAGSCSDNQLGFGPAQCTASAVCFLYVEPGTFVDLYHYSNLPYRATTFGFRCKAVVTQHQVSATGNVGSTNIAGFDKIYAGAQREGGRLVWYRSGIVYCGGGGKITYAVNIDDPGRSAC